MKTEVESECIPMTLENRWSIYHLEQMQRDDDQTLKGLEGTAGSFLPGGVCSWLQHLNVLETFQVQPRTFLRHPQGVPSSSCP